MAIYRPDWVEKVKFLDSISSLIDFYNSYDNIQILGDFNMTPDDPHLITFMEGHNLYNLINEPTCFKSTNGNCIDLILTNQKHSHMFSQTCEVGYSDHHVMIYTMLKTTFTKLPPKVIKYRCRRHYNQDKFYNDLMCNIANSTPGDYNDFEKAFEQALDDNMPQNTKVIRGNHKPDITKELKKQISIRSKLRKLANTTGSEEDIAKYKRQRNFVSLINNKAKKDYFRTLDPKKLEMNRKFFTTFKPFLSSKYSPDERILLIEDNEIISEIMNEYFTNITDSMNIKQ